MDRLTALDAEFLHLEDETAPMHIASICTFAGPAPTLAELRSAVAGKLDALPRYRQVVRTVPLELGRPIWVDDQRFSVDRHLRRAALAPPGDDAELDDLMSALMAHPLDRDRPLWEAWLVEGLSDERWALIFKVHHCMVDGIAGIHLLEAFLDLSPDVSTPDAATAWSPSPAPSPVGLIVGSWLGLAHDLVPWARRMTTLVTSPVDAAQGIAAFGAGALRLAAHLGPTPASGIQGTIGPHRRWSHVTFPLGDVTKVRRRFGGTVNDVLIACVTAGHRQLLLSRGEDPSTVVVRTAIPVSTRVWDAERDGGNRVSALIAELPVAIEDPVQRLRAVCELMARLKASHMAEAGDVLTSLADLAPPVVVGPLSRLAVRLEHRVAQRSMTTFTTNVPGPQFPLYCLGREMLEQHPYLGLTDGVRVTTAILSYNGRMSVGVTGDEDSVPDVAAMTDAVRAALADLVRAARRRSSST